MDHNRIIRRAFEIVRRYPVLWIFGFLIAVTSARSTGSNSGYQFSGRDFKPNGDFQLPEGFHNFPWPNIPQETINTAAGIAIGVICLLVLLVAVFTILHYVSVTASIRMVDRHEADGEKLRFRQGWRLGWTRAAFRIWLVDLLFGVGAFLVTILLFLLAATPLLLLLTGSDVANVVGVVATIGLIFLVILVIILLAAGLSILSQFIYRAVALENLGVFDAIHRGWVLIRRQLKDAVIMALILFGIGLVYTILLIPVSLVMVVVSLAAGGLPALLAGGITNIFAHGHIPQIVAIAVGLPIFFLVLSIPLGFLGGLLEIFNSSAWTLTYRETLALENVQKEAASEVDPVSS